jgi:hypothetical protein
MPFEIDHIYASFFHKTKIRQMKEYLSIGQKQQLARRAKPFTNEK